MSKASDRQERAARAEQMRKDRERAERRQRNVITVGIVTAVVALIAVASFGIYQVSKDNAKSTDLVAPAGTNDDYGFEYTSADVEAAAEADDADGGETEATPSADADAEPVKVTLYEDFQCPACASFEMQTAPYLMDLVSKNEITIEYRPISFLDRASANEYATRSLNAAMCVLDESDVPTWKKMHDLLYANQPAEGTAGPDDAALIATAAEAGVSGETLEACVNTEKFGPWIDDSYENAIDDGFSGTPWVVIDGKDVEDTSVAGVQAAIEAAKAA